MRQRQKQTGQTLTSQGSPPPELRPPQTTPLGVCSAATAHSRVCRWCCWVLSIEDGGLAQIDHCFRQSKIKVLKRRFYDKGVNILLYEGIDFREHTFVGRSAPSFSSGVQRTGATGALKGCRGCVSRPAIRINDTHVTKSMCNAASPQHMPGRQTADLRVCGSSYSGALTLFISFDATETSLDRDHTFRDANRLTGGATKSSGFNSQRRFGVAARSRRKSVEI